MSWLIIIVTMIITGRVGIVKNLSGIPRKNKQTNRGFPIYTAKENPHNSIDLPGSGGINGIIGNNKQVVNINHYYTLALAVSIVFLGFGLYFILHTARMSREETIGYIQNAVQQTTYAVDEHILEEFDTLMAAAVVAQDRDLLADDAVLHALMNGLEHHNGYVHIGFADANGNAIWIDEQDREHRADLSGEGFIQRTLAGEPSLSQVRFDKSNKTDIHYYSVPVYDGETSAVEGVLFAAEPQDSLRDIVNHSLYAGQGLAHIIDSKGEYIVRSNSPLVIGIGTSIFEVQTPLKAEVVDEILENLAVGRTGYIIKSFYGKNRLIAYAPLSVNDWHVFYAVPEDMVSAGIKTFTVGTIATVCVATAIFIFFILMIGIINNKNRKVLEHLPFVDPVTGHRNFSRFLLDAEKILKNAHSENYAICYSDIKNYKYINDVFGRDVGDRILRYLADFQNRISQEGEVCARISEDAFVALRRYKTKREIEKRFEGTAQQLAIFPETFSQGYKVELYGGVYLIDRADGALTLNDMLDRAIAAQEEVKLAAGTKHLGTYSSEMREKKLWETEVESKMEAALDNGEFKVYLQPKIDIQQGDRISGAEALVRWVSPEKGLIPPARFIGLFERNGFIIDLDRFVLDKVCRFYKEAVMSNGLPSCLLSVNVSRLGLMHPDFIRSYTQIRESYGIPAGCIELEFTESFAFGDNVMFRSIVAECKRNGFLCSMDDFGAGYSSLNMLKSIHVDVLKLDRQFFLYGDDAERGQELVKNIIAMAKALNMRTVAEGIDDKALIAQLRAMGCDVIQGNVFAKPMPMEDFGPFLESWYTCRGL